jgi:uncharacterized membrane protein YagU involved in acid resistance
MIGNGRNLAAGIAGGLLGGVLFGVMMAAMGMLGMVAMLVGSESTAVGWLVHLAISALFGVLYALALGPATTSTGRGAVLGAVAGLALWVVGALVVMPLWLGMGEMVFVVGTDQLFSLVGHLLYGVVLGVTYHAVAARSAVTGARQPART